MPELFFDRIQRLFAGNRYYNEFSDAVNHRLNQIIKERRLSRKRLKINKASIMNSFESIHNEILSALKINRNVSTRATYKHEANDVRVNSEGLRQAMADTVKARNRIEELFDELDILLGTDYKREVVGGEIEKEIHRLQSQSVNSILAERRPMSGIPEGFESEQDEEIHEG